MTSMSRFDRACVWGTAHSRLRYSPLPQSSRKRVCVCTYVLQCKDVNTECLLFQVNNKGSYSVTAFNNNRVGKAACTQRHTTLPHGQTISTSEAERYESVSYLCSLRSNYRSPRSDQRRNAPEQRAICLCRRWWMIYSVVRLKNTWPHQIYLPTFPSGCYWQARTRSAHGACVSAARHSSTDTPTTKLLHPSFRLSIYLYLSRLAIFVSRSSSYKLCVISINTNVITVKYIRSYGSLSTRVKQLFQCFLYIKYTGNCGYLHKLSLLQNPS